MSTREFLRKTKDACENSHARTVLSRNLANYNKKFQHGKEQFSDYQEARRRLNFFKYKTIETLEKNLTDFEANFSRRGGKVLYANKPSTALKYILEILKKSDVKKIVKSKSMICEEIGLEDFLLEHEIVTVETDLGEFIVQLAGEKPSHITAPALHKSAEEIYALLNEKLHTAFHRDTPKEEVVDFVRKHLRKEYKEAGAGITGCNFLIADTGAIALSENEANAILSACLPPVHIVVTSIEKVISNLINLELFQSMLATHGTGQKLTTYNHLFFGSDNFNVQGKKTKVYVVIIDNNRTELLKNISLREACYCIKCGACHNVCPVYKQIGGHGYDSVNNGPIGAVITPFIQGFENFYHLPFASTLCGKCNENCPVAINLTGLLIESRRIVIENKNTNKSERLVFKNMNSVFMKRKRMDIFSSGMKNKAVRFVLGKNWGLHRELPQFAKQSYNKKVRGKEI